MVSFQTALPEQELPPLPSRIEGRPFGADEHGRPIRQITGTGLLAAIRHMQDCVGQRIEQELPAGMTPQERQARIAKAQAAALDQLVERLNAAIPDPGFHVSRDYLLNEDNYYSHEFNLYLNEFARDILGDPAFHFHRALRGIPRSFVYLSRPLSLRQVYNLLPRLTARFTDSDIRVARTAPNSAMVQWHPERQLGQLPPILHRRYMHMACQSYQGVFAAIPRIHSNLPLARIKETRCLLHGDDYCEWEFTWQSPRPGIGVEVWGGVILSVALLGYTLARLPGWEWLAVFTTLLPAICGLLLRHMRRLAYDREQAERLLLETREGAEKQYDEWQQANADLQVSNVTLKQRLSELTALHEIGLALSATLDLDDLLDKSLRAVTTHLSFDRAMILLVDEARRVLAGGRAIGGTPEMAALMGQLQVSLDDPEAFLTQVIRSGKPMLVSDVHQVSDKRAQQYLQALQTRAFLAVPLITQGKVVGVLAVDNAITNRPIQENVQDLLFTVGAQIASAVDSTRLYETLEQRVEERTAALTAANAQLQQEIAEREQAQQAEREQRELAEALRDITEMLSGSLDFDKVLESIFTHVARVVPYDAATILMIRGEVVQVTHARGHDESVLGLQLPFKNMSHLLQIVETGRPFLIEDTWTSELWIPSPETSWVRSVVTAAIGADEQVIGFLSLDRGSPHAFTSEHVDRLQAFADQAAVAVRNARLLQDLRASNAQLREFITEREQAQQAEREQRFMAEALRDITAMLNRSLDFEEVLQCILTHVSRVVPYDAATILLIKDGVAEVTYARGYDESILGVGLSIEDVPNLRQAVETGRPSVIDDTQTSDIWVPSPETGWIRSDLTVAIGAKGQTIGFLCLDSDTPYAFTSEHMERLQAFADQAAVAVRNARLYASVEQARQTAETLRAAQLALTQSLDLDSICEELLDYLGRLVPYDSATIFLLESDTRISAHAVRGYERWVDSSLALAVTFDLEPGSTMHTIVTAQKSFLVPDTMQFPAWVRAPSGEHIRCWLGVPMLVGGKIIGVCSLDSTRPCFFTQEHIQLAESLAAQAAFAIQNARLFEDTQRRVAELETLRRSSLQLTSSLDLPSVLDSIAESTLNLVGADNCHIYLYDEANQALAFSTVLYKDGRTETAWEAPRRDGLTATVAREGRPMVINDAIHHPLYTTAEAREWTIHAIAGLPLKRAERVLGVLNIVFYEAHTFSEEELRVLSLLADQAAMAIENAHLYASSQEAKEAAEAAT